MLQGIIDLLLGRKHHLLSLAPPLEKSLFAVLSLVLLASLDSLDLLPFNLASLLDLLWHVSVSGNPSDLGHVLVPLTQSSIILELLSLSCTLDSLTTRCLGAP